MDIGDPATICLSEGSRQLIGEVEETSRKVHEYRPLSKDVVRSILDDLFPKRVHHSSAIEGNTLDLRETIAILKSGKVTGPKKREGTEVLNLGNAARQVTQWMDEKTSCHDPGKFLEIHGILLKDINDDWAGRFRNEQVMIAGAKYQPPDCAIVPEAVKTIMSRLAAGGSEGTLLRAAWAHWAIARIHPFFDGNGRIARLWQDLILLQEGLTCAIIQAEDRGEYLEALQTADEDDFNPLIELISRRVLSTFDLYTAATLRESERETWARSIVTEVEARDHAHLGRPLPEAEEQRKLTYLQWARRMAQLRYEFELSAAKLTAESTSVQVQIKSYPLIDQATWQKFLSGIFGELNWYFIVEVVRSKKRAWYRFYFNRHKWVDGLDDSTDRSEQRLAILVGKHRAQSSKDELLDPWAGNPDEITLREVFVVNDQFVRKRIDLRTQRPVYDRDISAMTIAQEFFDEVILNVLG